MEGVATPRVDGDERTGVQGERAEALGSISGNPAVHHDLSAAQEHRGLITDAVVVLDLQVAVIVELEAGVAEDEFGYAGEGAVVAEVEGTGGIDETPAERGSRLEVDGRPDAGTEEIERGSREFSGEGVISLTIEDEIGSG